MMDRSEGAQARDGSSVDTPTVTVIRGDGIGPEITEATLQILEAAGARLRYEEMPAGGSAIETDKDPLPQKTMDSIQRNRLALKGPLATPIGKGFRSVNVALRQELDLYANLRPARTIPGVPSRYENVDLVVVRENTEDLYAGVEHWVGRRNAAESIAIVTRHGSERIVKFAFEHARRQGRKKVTVVHKANILKMSQGLFLECFREAAQAYPDIEVDEIIVDAACMKLVLQPERFDVLVTTNMFGDIVSDLTAGLIGGLGVAPAANIGEGGAIFEAIHGTAPDIAGQGIANPTALTLSAALLLEHVGQTDAAARVRAAIFQALARPETRTRDLGGAADTRSFTAPDSAAI